MAPTGIYVSKSAFGPGSVVTAGLKSERREEASQGRAICGLGSPSEDLGRRCPAGEVCVPRGGELRPVPHNY